MERYKIGTVEPVVQFDNGSGPWNSIKPTPGQVDHLEMFIRRVHVELLDRWLYQWGAPDAILNIEHYLDNSGALLEFREEGFMDSSYCKRLYDYEVCYAKAFCEKLAPGKHYSIVSTSAWYGDPRGDKSIKFINGNENIFYALGGFRYWGKAEVDISLLRKEDILYDMDFTFILKDRYNWNWNPIKDETQGTTVGITEGIDWFDSDFGLLNLVGIARDFDIIGKYRHRIKWRKSGVPVPDKRFYPVPLRDYL